MSQRADYINNDLFEWVQFNRAIINTRDEPLADGSRFRRLHLLHGDTSVLPASLLLKVGTTALVLDLLEINALPEISLADPVATLHQLSRQTRGPWLVTMEDGGHEDAVELLHRYAEAARQKLSRRDTETDFLVEFWTETIELLPSVAEALVGRIDWVTKKWLFERFMEEEKISWDDPWLKSQDLEFHHTQAARSLGLALERTPAAWSLGRDDVTAAIRKPPSNTRAQARSFGMSAFREKTLPYYLDWEMIGLEGGPVLALDDPFDSDPKAVQSWIKDLNITPPTTRKGEKR
jgi:proteasome accessory factor A